MRVWRDLIALEDFFGNHISAAYLKPKKISKHHFKPRATSQNITIASVI